MEMSEEIKGYQARSLEKVKEDFAKYVNSIKDFLSQNQCDMEQDGIYWDENVIFSISSKVDQRRDYFKYFHQLDMSEYKETALIAFWVIKLQPLQMRHGEDHKALSSINEKLALYFILSILRGILQRKGEPTTVLDSLPLPYVKELVYSFRYRDLSKEALILLVESLAVFSGLNPYETKVSEKPDT